MIAVSKIGRRCGDPCNTCLGEIDRTVGPYRWRPCGVKLRTAYGTDITFAGATALEMPSYVMDAETTELFCPYGPGYGAGCDRQFCKVFYIHADPWGPPVWSRSTNIDFNLSLAMNNDSLYGLCDSDYTVLNYNRPTVVCPAPGSIVGALVRNYTANDGWLRKTRTIDGIVRSCIVETITNPSVALEVARIKVNTCGVERWVPTHIRAQTTYTYTMAVRSRFIGDVVDSRTREDYNWFNLFLPVLECTAYPDGIFGSTSYTFLNRGSTRASDGSPGNVDITTQSWVVGFTRNPNTTTTTTTNTSHSGDSCADPTFPTIPNPPPGDSALGFKALMAGQFQTVGYAETVTGYGPWQEITAGRQYLQGALSERPWTQGWDSGALGSRIALAQAGCQAAFIECNFGGNITNNGSFAIVRSSGRYVGALFPIAAIGSFAERAPLVVELDKCNAAEIDCGFATCGPSIF
jgi:hypothetical protein